MGEQEESGNHSRKTEQTDTRQKPQTLRGLEIAAHRPHPQPSPPSLATRTASTQLLLRAKTFSSGSFANDRESSVYEDFQRAWACSMPPHTLQSQARRAPPISTSLPTHHPSNHHFILSLSCYCIIINYLTGFVEQGSVCINKSLF